MMGQQWEFFPHRELKCRCCGEMHMDDEFMKKLVELRESCGFPFPITSAFRCPAHNLSVSKTGMAGPHTTGKAVDILISGANAADIIRMAMVAGFMGIGIRQHGDWSKRIVHLDMLNRSFQTVWTY